MGWGASSNAYREAFQGFGPLEGVTIVAGKGLAFVNFLSVDSAVRARTAMHNRASPLPSHGGGQWQCQLP